MIPDRLIVEFDQALRTLFVPATGAAPRPDAGIEDEEMPAAEKRHAARLMRVNHSGEICARALYQGQAMAGSNPVAVDCLRQAALEENNHLAWTGQRVEELGGARSLFNPLWYFGAFGVGYLAGKLGDDWSTGCLAETEKQIEAHLTDHMKRLPVQDQKSARLLERMRADETEHASAAARLGARELPWIVRQSMFVASRLMARISYYL